MRWCLAQTGLSALTWSGLKSFPGGDGLSLGLKGQQALNMKSWGECRVSYPSTSSVKLGLWIGQFHIHLFLLPSAR